MLHDLRRNEQHYDRVLREKTPLYYERFDTEMLTKRPLVAALLETAYAALFPTKAGDVLDVGCGTGYYFPILAQHTTRLLGVDICQRMLDEAQQLIDRYQLSQCAVTRGSALALPVADQSFDVVHVWDVLHHVADVPQVIAEITRVLRPGGRLIAIEPNLLNPSIAWYHARRRSEWRLFTQNQFSIPRQLRAGFDVSIGYDNTIISFLNERTYWIWKLANGITALPLCRRLSFRYLLDCHKRDVAEDAV